MLNTSSITRFLSMPAKSSGITGPAAATAKANKLTSKPACAILILNFSARSGKIPSTPISVLMIPKTPIVKIKISKLFFSFITSPVNKNVDPQHPENPQKQNFQQIRSAAFAAVNYFKLALKKLSSLSNGISSTLS